MNFPCYPLLVDFIPVHKAIHRDSIESLSYGTKIREGWGKLQKRVIPSIIQIFLSNQAFASQIISFNMIAQPSVKYCLKPNTLSIYPTLNDFLPSAEHC